MIGCIKEVISRMFSSSRSPRIVGATAEDFEAMASSHSSSEEIAKQKKIIAHLESIRPKIALKFQLAQAEDQLKIARQKLFELTGDPKDAIVSPVTEEKKAKVALDQITNGRKRLRELERQARTAPVTHIGHISIDHIPNGTHHKDWNVLVNGEPIDGAVEAHEDVGYYATYVTDEGRPIRDINDNLVTKIVYAPITLVYSGDNPRYYHFKHKTL